MEASGPLEPTNVTEIQGTRVTILEGVSGVNRIWVEIGTSERKMRAFYPLRQIKKSMHRTSQGLYQQANPPGDQLFLTETPPRHS